MTGLTRIFDQEIWYRASPLALVFFFGKTIRSGFEQFKSLVLPNSFVLAWFLAQRNWMLIGILVSIWIFALLAVSFIRYWRFRFKFTPNSISVREGVIKERQLDLEYERIRAVNYKRGLIDRVLGLTGISFDTAGTGEVEATIPAVSMEFADSLRLSIETKRDATFEPTPNKVVSESEGENILIRTVKWPDILKIGFCSGSFVFLISMLVTLPPVLAQINFINATEPVGFEYLRAFDWARRHVHEIHHAFFPGFDLNAVLFLLVVLAFLALLILAIIVNIVGAIFRWYNFTLFREGNSLKSVSGLTTVRETRITLPKIQCVFISENLRSRRFSFFKVTAMQSRSQEEHTLVIPLASTNRCTELCHLMFNDATTGMQMEPRDKDFKQVSPTYFWVGFLNVGVIPCLLALAAAFLLYPSALVLLLVTWLPIVALFQYLKWRKAGYLYNENAIVHRKGLLTYSLATMPFSKIQSVSVHQNIIQYWTQRATLKIANSTHAVEIPYLDITVARDFRDYLLYYIESSVEDWQ